MPKISCEQLEEWAQVIYENCGEGENFNLSLYDVVMELRTHSEAWKAAEQSTHPIGTQPRKFRTVDQIYKCYIKGFKRSSCGLRKPLEVIKL